MKKKIIFLNFLIFFSEMVYTFFRILLYLVNEMKNETTMKRLVKH